MYRFWRRLLFRLDAERAHRIATGALLAASKFPRLAALIRRRYTIDDPELRQEVFGLTFPNPVGLAAGFDKNAKYFQALVLLGFGSVEIGTVTARPQPGNPKPRLFRLRDDEAILNRMGFNNEGAAAVARHLRRPCAIPLGVNIGRSKVVPNEQAVGDYLEALELLWPRASYVAINVSSPNTPELRALQAKDRLGPLLSALKARLGELATAANRLAPPLLLKISPDLDAAELDGICDVVLEYAVDGVIATNTTVSRAGLRSSLARIPRPEEGGVSGKPLAERTIATVGALFRRLGAAVPIVAAGGIDGPDMAWRAIAAGARLIQVYTALIYHGPGLVRSINRGLIARLRQLGVSRLADVAGQGRALLEATDPAVR